MKPLLSFLLLLVVSSSNIAHAKIFTIQILAAQQPDISAVKSSPVGRYKIHAEKADNGLIRIKLGSFLSHSDAKAALPFIKDNGYPDAFISTVTNSPSIKPSPSPSIYSDRETTVVAPQAKPVSFLNRPLLDHRKSPAWDRLTPEQKDNIVYIDNELFVKQNGRFIPLSKF